ncbi:MAG: hypothetical protein K9H49_20195 [Bacteroidales bacterium]|nr:hypothetical protein [Bacteroidales bacterium]
MKRTFFVFILFALFFSGCKQAEPEKITVELGALTPYALSPETLYGKVQKVTEKSYYADYVDGKFVKKERIGLAARDTFNWTNDFVAEFDESGQIIRVDYLDEKDNVYENNLIHFQGEDTMFVMGYKNDSLNSKVLVHIDELGRYNKSEILDKETDTIKTYILTEFNEKDQILAWQFYDLEDNKVQKHVFSYNEQGRRNNYQYFNSKGERTVEMKFHYNESGFVDIHTLIDKNGEESVWEINYEYDDMGNYLEAEYTDGKIYIITERSYEYFPE